MSPGLVNAQQRPASSGIGVVTALQGQATVARQALPAGSPLHFKDDVFFRDEVATKERSTVRLLLGGKGVVTVREQSQVTLDETVAADGARRSILSVLAGKIAATVAHSLMRPGDEVEVRTPDAVAAIRGTVLIAEYIPPKQSAEAAKPVLLASSAPGPFLAQVGGASGGLSNFFVLTGNVVITPLGQPPVTLGPLQSMSVTATAGGVRPGAVQNITPAQLAQVIQGLDAGRPITGEAGTIAAAQSLIATLLTQALVGSTGGGGILLPPTPVLPPQPPPPCTGCDSITTSNSLPSGLLLSLNDTAIAMSGVPVAEFTSGPANAIVPLDISGTPGAAVDLTNFNVKTSPFLPVVGNPITHSGPMISLSNAALMGFDVSSAFGGVSNLDSILNLESSTFDPTTLAGATAPILRIAGTSVTNTGGPLVSVANSSGLFTLGSLLSLEAGSLTATGPGLDASNSGVFVGGPVFALRGGSRIAWSGGGPLIRLVNSELFAGGGFGNSDGAGNVVSISGAPGDRAVMLDATDSQIFFGPNGIPNAGADSDVNVFSAPPGVPLFRLTGSRYLDTDPDGELIPHSGGTSTFNGLLLVSTGSSTGHSSIEIAGKVFDVCCGEHLTTTTTEPLIQLDRTSLFISSSLSGTVSGNISGNLVQICCGNSASSAPSSLTVNGPILSGANGTNLLVEASLLRIANGGQLTSNSTDSIFSLTGGSHSAGTVLEMDSGLLTASAPVLKMLNGSMNTSNVNGAMQLFQSSVTSNGPVIGLDNSTLQVNNGPLLSVTGGSSMTVNGDFATLVNGAKIIVQNGPMISVDGRNATTGAVSTLNVTGALVNFKAGSASSQVMITNAITPNASPGGVPVFKDGTSSVSIGPNPYKGYPSNGIVNTGSGSVIRATNGANVNIAAP